MYQALAEFLVGQLRMRPVVGSGPISAESRRRRASQRRSPESEAGDGVADADCARLDDTAVDATQAKFFAFADVDEPQGVAAESGCELGAAPVWFGRDLHGGIA